MSYIENIEKYAKQATTMPEDFGYWGNKDMFDTWGFAILIRAEILMY